MQTISSNILTTYNCNKSVFMHMITYITKQSTVAIKLLSAKQNCRYITEHSYNNNFAITFSDFALLWLCYTTIITNCVHSIAKTNDLLCEIQKLS